MFWFKRLAVSPIHGSSATIDAVRTNRPFAAGDVPDTGVPPALAADMSIDERVPNSYVWNAHGDKQPEAVGWSRVRFANYAFLRVDGRPGPLVSEMYVVGVDEYGHEFDKVTYRRPVRT